MQFRPCIDIHNGRVKQIVGGSLRDEKDQATENFVSDYDSKYYAQLYEKYHIVGGHVILLNGKDSPFYQATKQEAIKALQTYPNALQVGGGMTADNAELFMEAGASHIIVTSYVFEDGYIRMDRLDRLISAVGKEHIVLDLSCKKTLDGYYIATNRWQNITQQALSIDFLNKLSSYCDEFLIHAVDVEGKNNGVEEGVLRLLADYKGNPVTYAGGVHSLEELKRLKELGKNKVNVTIGSAMKMFGGTLKLEDVLDICKKEE